MKNIKLLNTITLCLLLFSSFFYAQNNIIALNALPGGTEGNTLYTDSSLLNIDDSGLVSYNNSNSSDDWAVSSSGITHSEAFNSTFAITFGGMATTNTTNSVDFGKKITSGGIDRAANGNLGVRGNTNGIDVNEGIFFGLDLTNLSPLISVKIKSVSVNLVTQTEETGTIVSRLNTSKKIVFGTAGSTGVNQVISGGSGILDISSFNVYLVGGQINTDMLSIFNSSINTNNIRITDVELEVILNTPNIISLNTLPGGSEGNTRYTDSSILSINSSGAVSYSNSSSIDDWAVSSSGITHSEAFNSTFAITFGGIATTDTSNGMNFGKMISPGGIDRAANGDLGIRGNTNGIDVGEGYFFGLDLTNLNPTVSIKIKSVSVNFLAGTEETGTIVSRLNTSKKIVFGTAGSTEVNQVISGGSGIIDISSFNVYLVGGQINTDMLSIFNSSINTNNIRVTDVELEVLTNNLDPLTISSISHPRLLLKQNDESLIDTLITQSSKFSTIHNHIIERADDFLNSPTIVKPNSGRFLDEARYAITQIFYLSYAYRMTGTNSYLTKAESVINTLSDFNRWNHSGSQDLDTAETCFAVAIGYDWLYDDLSTSTKQNAREAIYNYGLLQLKNRPFWELSSNWNQVCIGGLAFGAMAIYGDGTTEMDTEAEYVLNRILTKNPNSLNEYADGNYPEGTMYWAYGSTYQVLLLSALEGVYGDSHEGINRLTNTPGFLESAAYMQYATGPTSLYYNYGDSTEKRQPLPATIWMAKKLNNPNLLFEENKLLEKGSYLKTHQEERFLPISLIFGKDIDLSSLTPPSSKTWTGNGIQPVAMIRTQWQGSQGKYMGVKAGTPNYSHGSMDVGSFVYDSQGMRWASDFEKFDYTAVGNVIGRLGNYNQNSARWDIFRVRNISHNTLSIKKTTENNWQHHKANGVTPIEEIYDTEEKRGAMVNMTNILGLNNELNSSKRSVYIENDSVFTVEDDIENGNESIDVYWNMVTTGIVEKINASELKLSQGGKTVILKIVSSNSSVPFTIATNRSTDPVDYNPAATYERKNEGTVMVGFEATIPANANVKFTVTITDGTEILPSEVQPVNTILLELPNPNTGLEANLLFSDSSEFFINDNGDIDIMGFSTDYAWKVYGETDFAELFDKSFVFSWDAMGSADTISGTTYGALLTQAGIDRSADGQLGVRGGPSNGIDPYEGYRIGLDLSNFPPSNSLKLIKVGVTFVNSNEIGFVVNRNDTTNKLSFGGNNSGADVTISNGLLDVSALDISLTGGNIDNDLASIFNTSPSGNFRINKYVFQLADSLSFKLLSISDGINNDFKVFPNPFHDNITMLLPRNKNIQISIYNTLGVTVYKQEISPSTINDNKTTINLQNVNSGIYYMKINDSKNILIKKIIKN